MASPKSEASGPKPDTYTRDDHHISRQNIDADAMKIMYRLLRNGYKAYLVGGGVRDLLLDKKPKDFDIATDATPRKIKELFRNSRIIGRRFKLVHIFFKGGKIIEVSTFRDVSDPAEPQENPENEHAQRARDNKYGTEATDALRRDITINGLFYDLSNFSIIDYVGGMNDLRDRIVRVIGDPDIRFAEDPVRLMRVVRHAVRAGFAIEDLCWQSILRNRELLKQSSQVRVYEELKKDLCSGYALPILSLLEKTGLLEMLLPELSRDQMLSLDHHFSACLARADEMVRLGKPVNVTAVLALMAIFLGSPAGPWDIDVAMSDFEDLERLSEHMSRCFESLQVPRKEKERVGEIIILLARLIRYGLSQKVRASLARTEYLTDLLAVMEFVEAPFQADEILQVVEDGRHHRRSGHHPHDQHQPHVEVGTHGDHQDERHDNRGGNRGHRGGRRHRGAGGMRRFL